MTFIGLFSGMFILIGDKEPLYKCQNMCKQCLSEKATSSVETKLQQYAQVRISRLLFLCKVYCIYLNILYLQNLLSGKCTSLSFYHCQFFLWLWLYNLSIGCQYIHINWLCVCFFAKDDFVEQYLYKISASPKILSTCKYFKLYSCYC